MDSSSTSGMGSFSDASWTLELVSATFKSVSLGDTDRDTFYAIHDSVADNDDVHWAVLQTAF